MPLPAHPFIEAPEVDLLLGFGQLLPVVLALDLELITHQWSGKVPIARNVDDGNLLGQRESALGATGTASAAEGWRTDRLVRKHHRVRDPVLLPQSLREQVQRTVSKHS